MIWVKPKWFVAENVRGLISIDGGNVFKTILKTFENCGYNVFPFLVSFDEYQVPQKRKRLIIVGMRNDFKFEFELPKPIMCDTSVETALKNIPKDAANNEIYYSEYTEKILKYILPGENAYSKPLPKEISLCKRYGKPFKRLISSEPSYTIIASGGKGKDVYHYNQDRCLTNRELARLQTFPDDFVFLGTRRQVRKQIGMAVPPKGMFHILTAIIEIFSTN